MEARDLMALVDEADCNSEVCFIDSGRHQQVCGWAKNLIEVSLKAGIKEVVEWVNHCPKCGAYLPKNLNGSRTFKCDHCMWNGQAKLNDWGVKKWQKLEPEELG